MITSVTVSNLQFTSATGTAVFTVTGASARANASNNFGQTEDEVSNTLPFAEAGASVPFATAFASANLPSNSVTGITFAMLGACSCTGASFSISTLTGTLVITGTQGNVDVTISGLIEMLRDVDTDQFGVLAESEVLFDIFVNGVSVFQIDSLIPLSGPNLRALVEASDQISRTITLQGGVENTINVRLSTRALAVNEVPEPATVVLLVSGLGFMTGVLKKRRRKADQ
ncbi:MAG: PEP-CTERM sorting domain-containing protein [Pyrinomonadaceae bacterium]